MRAAGATSDARGGRLSGTAPAWDRFAHWPRDGAIAVLAGFAALLLAAALVYAGHAAPPGAAPPAPSAVVDVAADRVRKDADLALYETIARRVGTGEGYYAVALAEQRARGFPVRPGIAVRLPTLAYLTAWLGPGGLVWLGAALVLGVLAAWWRRLADEPGGHEHRPIMLVLIVIGLATGAKPYYAALHEVWAGLLIALAFGLHRPGRWLAAWPAAAAALAIREHALPFVLLLAAMAAWRRDWRETAAWSVLVTMFGAGLAWHVLTVDALLLDSDRPSPPWLVLRGLYGWISNVVDSTALHLLPAWLAGPLALLPLLGWAAWRTAAGATGFLFHLGYGTAIMIAGRDNNFYWALAVTPTWFMGVRFVPRALTSLWRNAMTAPGAS